MGGNDLVLGKLTIGRDKITDQALLDIVYFFTETYKTCYTPFKLPQFEGIKKKKVTWLVVLISRRKRPLTLYGKFFIVLPETGHMAEASLVTPPTC